MRSAKTTLDKKAARLLAIRDALDQEIKLLKAEIQLRKRGILVLAMKQHHEAGCHACLPGRYCWTDDQLARSFLTLWALADQVERVRLSTKQSTSRLRRKAA